MLPDGHISESWAGAGVRTKRLDDWRDADIYEVPATAPQIAVIAAYCARREAVGTKYDWLGPARFLDFFRVFARGEPPENRDFCSEHVVLALDTAGIHLFRRTKAHEVPPHWLPRSILASGPFAPEEYPDLTAK